MALISLRQLLDYASEHDFGMSDFSSVESINDIDSAFWLEQECLLNHIRPLPIYWTWRFLGSCDFGFCIYQYLIKFWMCFSIQIGLSNIPQQSPVIYRLRCPFKKGFGRDPPCIMIM